MSEKKKEEGAEPKAPSDFGDLGFVDGGFSEEAQAASDFADTTVTNIHAKRLNTEETRKQIRETHSDLRARAVALQRTAPPDYIEVKTVMQAGVPLSTPINSDKNVLDTFAVLFGDGDDRPCFDSFRGFTVGHNGVVIDDNYDMTEIIDALVTFRIPSPRIEAVSGLFKVFARLRRRNSLTDRMDKQVPAWDGDNRLDSQLIKLFAPLDTELTREFGRYFWLSLYCRATYPGCNASMVLALFGAHGIGKSYLSKLICEEMMGDRKSDSVTLDWGMNLNDFLRNITGNSVIANVSEMAGFNRADMTKIKNFTTKTTDMFDHKFERSNMQSRQWIMVMDGNEYKGLQRDETGNRRFYPMFVGQLPHDETGQIAYRDDFYVDYDAFRSDFWQIMAECRVWLAENGGIEGYHRFVSALEKKVRDFNEVEVKHDRGTVRDDDLEAYLPQALAGCTVRISAADPVGTSGGRPTEKVGLYVTVADLRNALSECSKRNIRMIPAHLKPKMAALGAVSTKLKNLPVFLWTDMHNAGDWKAFIKGLGLSDGIAVSGSLNAKDDEGF